MKIIHFIQRMTIWVLLAALLQNLYIMARFFWWTTPTQPLIVGTFVFSVIAVIWFLVAIAGVFVDRHIDSKEDPMLVEEV